jgi:hypothetical protein
MFIRRPTILLLAVLLILGCRPESDETAVRTRANLVFEPHPPAVGLTRVILTLTDPAGQPVRAGQLEVEGNMNHAGMRPVFTRLEETEPGRYAGTIEFTMGGDWYLLVTGVSSDGQRLDLKLNVSGVKPQ